MTISPAANSQDYPPLTGRPIKNTICLFDVDDTLTPPRLPASAEMLEALKALRKKVAIGYVGGSNMVKQEEQLGVPAGVPVTAMFDYCFPENGLLAYKMGAALPSNSFIQWFGEEEYKKFVRFVLHYIADLDIPIKRGTFVEFRSGMVNVSPIGRNVSTSERNEFSNYDLEHKVRETMIEALKKEFSHLDLKYSIGGKISFDVFPVGWDKTFCLRHLENEKNISGGIEYRDIHFFGDKCFEGGNDWEIYSDKRTIGHYVRNPEHTLELIKDMFGV